MATLPSPPDDLTPEQLFLGHLDLVERVIAHACRRCPFSHQEREDFAGTVRLKLVEDDYSRIRQFRGQSSIETFLTIVVRRLLLDYQNSVWGKWRPSAEAERLGEVAMWLERLLVREERSFDEACQILRLNHRVEMSAAELADLRAKLPTKNVRRFVPEERLAAEPSRELRPDERLEAKERAMEGRRLLGIFREAFASLPKEDQFFLRELTDFKVADVARRRGVDQKALYRRRDKLLKKLRLELERRGVRRQDVAKILGSWADSPAEDF